ncbi:hypothetical protein GGR54DRAFT_173004 [Hypoxylon sp. NC1633]|nr:hypothetical protein GGR54DRAFT_173004 [Hypoxylon sp. NC1633]
MHWQFWGLWDAYLSAPIERLVTSGTCINHSNVSFYCITLATTPCTVFTFTSSSEPSDHVVLHYFVHVRGRWYASGIAILHEHTPEVLLSDHGTDHGISKSLSITCSQSDSAIRDADARRQTPDTIQATNRVHWVFPSLYCNGSPNKSSRSFSLHPSMKPVTPMFHLVLPRSIGYRLTLPIRAAVHNDLYNHHVSNSVDLLTGTAQLYNQHDPIQLPYSCIIHTDRC